MNTGKIIVLVFIITAVAIGISSNWIMTSNQSSALANQAGIGLSKVQKACVAWAYVNGNSYPEHISLLWSNSLFHPELLTDPRVFEDSIWHVGEIDARPFMAELRDRINDEDSMDRTPLLQAIANLTPQPYYRFGDYWFTTITKTNANSNMIFGWTIPDENGHRFVVYDNGKPRRISAADWKTACKRDLETRKELGLTLFEFPPE